MSTPSTEQLLRARFNELLKARDDKQAIQKPFRDEINAKYALIAELQAEINLLADKMHETTPSLVAVEEELAKLASVLGGKRMSDAA